MINKKGIFESFFYQINKKYHGIQIRLNPGSMEKSSKVMNIGMTHSINKSILLLGPSRAKAASFRFRRLV